MLSTPVVAGVNQTCVHHLELRHLIDLHDGLLLSDKGTILQEIRRDYFNNEALYNRHIGF